MSLVLTAATIAAFSFTSGVDTTFAVSKGMELQIANFAGSINVRSWEKNSVRLQARSGSKDRIAVKRDADILLIKTYSQRSAQHMVELEITAPSWMDLTASGVNTDVDIEGTKGRVRVDTVHGDIMVVGGRGQIELNAINQDIHLTDASGTVFSETVNGDLTLQRIASDSVEVSTVNGEIFYEGTIRDRGVYRFTSHNGDVAVALPNTANATVNVSTFSGEFASDFPVMLSETKPGRRFCFTVGRGSAQVQLESFQGTIHIFRPGTYGSVADLERGESRSHKHKEKNKSSDDDSDSDSDSDDDHDEDDE
jgi:DUF4097 and DUF4098 domain-containing protein YvlB